MALLSPKTYRMTRASFGNLRSLGGGTRNALSISYGWTNTKSKVANAASSFILGATATSNAAATTVTTGFANPDVPRAFVITPSGTTANVAATAIVVTGTNVEGKVITENFTPSAGSASVVNGTKAFRTIISVVFPQQSGTGVNFAIGTRNLLGLNHRLATTASTATVRVYSVTGAGVRALQAAPSAVATDATNVESNTFTPAVTPDGTTAYSVHYFFYNWAIDPINGNPVYGA